MVDAVRRHELALNQGSPLAGFLTRAGQAPFQVLDEERIPRTHPRDVAPAEGNGRFRRSDQHGALRFHPPDLLLQIIHLVTKVM